MIGSMAIVSLNGRAPLLEAHESPVLGRDCRLDLRGLKWATPFDVAALATLVRRANMRGYAPIVEPPTDAAVRRYLVDLGAADHIPGTWGEEAGSAVDRPLLRLTHLDESHEWDDLVNNQWPAVATRLKNPKLASRLFEILGELIDNATTHGNSEVGTFVCVQRYTGDTSGLSPGLWVGIADAGMGIPRHLRRREEYADFGTDEELIGLARKPWVTGTRDRRGWGLTEVFEQLGQAGVSNVVMRSGRGEARYWFRSGRMSGARYRGLRRSVPGTWVHAEIQEAIDA